jgi:glycosyltransferase involved in cell wall biosynthesis
MGGTEYIRNLLQAIDAARTANGAEVRTSLIVGEKQQTAWQETAADSVAVVGRRSKPMPLLGHFIRPSNKHFLRAVRDQGCDFIYPLTYDNEYNVEVKLPLGAVDFQWAAWIPDFQHRHLPQLFSEKEIAKRERGIEELVREAPRIVLSSRTAAADLSRFYPGAAPKAEVLTFATFPQAEWYTAEGGEDLSWLPQRFFLVSNQFWKHKNHLVVFEALRILQERGIKPAIVCTGQIQDFRDPDYANVILQTVHRFGIASQVLLLGLVARRSQIEMMRRCVAVVQPSLFEGWSTVVEDSRVLGKPCLLSDIPVHREQNPPEAQFFDPHSAKSLADLLAQTWDSRKAGMDAEGEAEARRSAEARIIEVGRTFLEITERSCAR